MKSFITMLIVLLPAVVLAADPPKASKPWTAAPSAKPLATEVKATPQVLAYLKDISSTYQNLNRYQFEGTLVRRGDAPGMERLEVPFKLVVDKPRRARTEIRNPNLNIIAVTDSEQMWVYVPQMKQYTQQSANVFAPGTTNAEIGQKLATGTPIERYLNLTNGLRSARILRDETIDVGGRKVACTVVEALYQDPQGLPVQMLPNKLWVEKATKLVVRDSVAMLLSNTDGSTVHVFQGTVYTIARGNAPIADSMFVFNPPPGTEKVDQFSMGGQTAVSPLVGKPAEDFSLAALDVSMNKLSGLKGSVVVLDFWATWCGPCRREMPNIVKIHHELSKKGLAVVAVNMQEDKGKVSSFLKTNQYDLPVWLDVNGVVAGKYGASAIPTLVIIDREGKVASHMVGLREERELRAELKKVGIE